MGSVWVRREAQDDVVSTEAKAVAEDGVDFSIDADVGSVVEIEVRLGMVVIDRRRDHAVADDHRAYDSLNRARGVVEAQG